MSIQEVLKADKESRQQNKLPADSALHKLDNLNFDLSYDYNMPTLINNNDYNRAKIAHRSSADFREEYFKHFPLLEKVDLTNVNCWWFGRPLFN